LIIIPLKWGFSIAFYNPKKKLILKYGSSRPCGRNHCQRSIHVEEIAVNYCRINDKRNNYKIYIWRFNSQGEVKPAYCCHRCTKIINKYNYNNKIYTFTEDGIRSSIIDNPKVSLGYKLNEWGIK